MADVSRVVLPNNTGYDLKDKNAARTIDFNQEPGAPENFYVELKNAAGTVIDQRHMYINFDGQDLLVGDFTTQDKEVSRVGLPAQNVDYSFEQNQQTPNEFWFKIWVNGEEKASHWMLISKNGSDLVLQDLSDGVEVFRLTI